VAKIICGVDVSSKSLDVFLNRCFHHFPNTVAGIDDLFALCQQHHVDLVAVEASGGYERRLYRQLWAAGLPVALCNARAVRDFAKAMGLLEKTDRIDAAIIAEYAATNKKLVAHAPQSSQHEHLRALVTRLRQLTEIRATQRQQRLLVTDPAVLETFTRVLAFLTAEIRQLQHSIAQLIDADPLWQPLDRAFRSIKGVADRTVACLMAELPEIGTLSNKAISKLVGLAPLADDSGKRHGHRSIRGGRTTVRHLLFVIATVVRRCQPDFAAFSQRLAARGKPKKVILVALAHKLLIRLNAKARDARRQFSPPIPSAAFTTTVPS
jgi:transposase